VRDFCCWGSTNDAPCSGEPGFRRDFGAAAARVTSEVPGYLAAGGQSDGAIRSPGGPAGPGLGRGGGGRRAGSG
jgi:hypothetical protein